MASCWRSAILTIAALAAAIAMAPAGGTDPPVAGARDEPAPEDLVFVTDDADGLGADGCEMIRVVDTRSGGPVGRSHWRKSPGRLTLTSDAGLVLSGLNNGGAWVRVMLRSSDVGGAWRSRDVGYSVPLGGPLAISPDDETLLTARQRPEVAKHRVTDITLTSLGQAVGVYTGVQAAEIVFSPDARTAYVIDTNGEVVVVDVESMQAVGPPIPYTPVKIRQAWRLRHTFASMSPDGRYLVINTLGGDVNVLDVAQRRCLSSSGHAAARAPCRHSRAGPAVQHIPLTHGDHADRHAGLDRAR